MMKMKKNHARKYLPNTREGGSRVESKNRTYVQTTSFQSMMSNAKRRSDEHFVVFTFLGFSDIFVVLRQAVVDKKKNENENFLGKCFVILSIDSHSVFILHAI